MKSSTSVIALAACFAPLVLASPLHMERHAEAQVDVKYVTDTAVQTEYAHVTEYVTAGAPQATTTEVTVTAGESSAAPSSSAAAPDTHNKNAHAGEHHWSYSHDQPSSSTPAPAPPAQPTPSTTSTTEPAPSMPAFTPPSSTPSPTTETPSTTAAPSPTVAPSAQNPGTATAGMTYSSAVAAPASSIVATTGDEAYNAFDGTLQAASLKATNDWRAKYQAPPVVWNLTLEQQIVDVNMNKDGRSCLFEHTGSGCGQNIGAGYDGPTAAIGAWEDEYNPANYTNGVWTGGLNHFTQLVWKDTTSIGCAAINCDSSHPGATAHGWFYVCNYYPTGNMVGEGADNIMPPK